MLKRFKIFGSLNELCSNCLKKQEISKNEMNWGICKKSNTLSYYNGVGCLRLISNFDVTFFKNFMTTKKESLIGSYNYCDLHHDLKMCEFHCASDRFKSFNYHVTLFGTKPVDAPLLNNVHNNVQIFYSINRNTNCFKLTTIKKDVIFTLLNGNATHILETPKHMPFRPFCTFKQKEIPEGNKEKLSVPITKTQKLKNAVKDYGIVIVVFHTTIALASLGCCYFAISSGLVGSGYFTSWGIDEGATAAEVGSSFVIAYAIHKMMAPWRIGLTLTVVPFVVKKLRIKGYLKPLKPKE